MDNTACERIFEDTDPANQYGIITADADDSIAVEFLGSKPTITENTTNILGVSTGNLGVSLSKYSTANAISFTWQELTQNTARLYLGVRITTASGAVYTLKYEDNNKALVYNVGANGALTEAGTVDYYYADLEASKREGAGTNDRATWILSETSSRYMTVAIPFTSFENISGGTFGDFSDIAKIDFFHSFFAGATVQAKTVISNVSLATIAESTATNFVDIYDGENYSLFSESYDNFDASQYARVVGLDEGEWSIDRNYFGDWYRVNLPFNSDLLSEGSAVLSDKAGISFHYKDLGNAKFYADFACFESTLWVGAANRYLTGLSFEAGYEGDVYIPFSAFKGSHQLNPFAEGSKALPYAVLYFSNDKSNTANFSITDFKVVTEEPKEEEEVELTEHIVDMDSDFYGVDIDTRGTVFALWDSVSVQAANRVEGSAMNAGITALDASFTVDNSKYLALQYFSYSNINPALQVSITDTNGTTYSLKESLIYYVKNVGSEVATMSSSDGKIYPFGQGNSVGFYDFFSGLVYVPVSAFGVADGTSIAKISMYTDINTCRLLKCNYGLIAMADQVGAANGTEIWSATDATLGTDYEVYFDTQVADVVVADYIDVKVLKKGQVSFTGKFNDYVTSDATAGGYDNLEFRFPETLRNSEGYIDLTGMDGLLLDIENLSSEVITYEFAYWAADGAKWGSNWGKGQVLYIPEEGEAFWTVLGKIPGDFSGYLYIPFLASEDNPVFVGGVTEFPGLVRNSGTFGVDSFRLYTSAGVNTERDLMINSIRVISDLNDYVTTVTVTGEHITVTPISVAKDVEQTFTFTAEEGYEIVSVKYNNETITLTDGTYTTVTTEEMAFEVETQEIEYTITYVLNGGENSANNPTTFKVTSNVFALEEATREGYEFAGWYLSEDFSGAKIQYVTKGTVGDITVYAR